MINAKGLFSIEKQQEFNTILDKLIEDSDFREQSGQNNSSFIKKNKGAVIQILDYLRI
ncbi:hypothetical protein JCM19274_4190 [Algibacter lectus]|nr:hypothetical protein JCM19274_4190 [Algibacter lectus]